LHIFALSPIPVLNIAYMVTTLSRLIPSDFSLEIYRAKHALYGTEDADEDNCNSASLVSVAWPKVSQIIFLPWLVDLRNLVDFQWQRTFWQLGSLYLN